MMRWRAVTAALRRRGCTETRREVSMPGTLAGDRHGCDEHDLEIFGEPASLLASQRAGTAVRTSSLPVPSQYTVVLPSINKPVYATLLPRTPCVVTQICRTH
jgi:hypothetical protein